VNECVVKITKAEEAQSSWDVQVFYNGVLVYVERCYESCIPDVLSMVAQLHTKHMMLERQAEYFRGLLDRV